MRNLLAFLAVISPIPALASIDANLKYGQFSTEVTELQDFLVDKGFLKTSPTGFFGLLTLNAVKTYQASIGLPNTGYVGIMTRTAVNAELATFLASSTEAEASELNTNVQTNNEPVATPILGNAVNQSAKVNPFPRTTGGDDDPSMIESCDRAKVWLQVFGYDAQKTADRNYRELLLDRGVDPRYATSTYWSTELKSYINKTIDAHTKELNTAILHISQGTKLVETYCQ